MPTPTAETMVFQFVFDGILQTIQTFANQTASTMAQVIGPAAATCFGIYMLLWNFAMVRGMIQSPLTDFYTRCMRGTLIITFATTMGIYNNYISDTVWQVPGAVASEIVSFGSTTGGTGGNAATAAMLDKALGAGIQAGSAAWQKMSAFHTMAAIGYAAMAVAIWITTALVCAYAAALVAITNIGCAIMIGLGPLFIILLMFEATTPFFSAWVKQLTTFMLMFLILASVISLMFSFYTPFITSIASMSSDEVVIAFVKVVAISALCVLVLHQSNHWAAGLAGGVSITAQGAIGRMVGGGARTLINSNYDPNKKNRDGTTGGFRYRGAVPSTVNAARYAARQARHAYQRRNTVSKD